MWKSSAVLLTGLLAVASARGEVPESNALSAVRAKGFVEIATYADFPPYSQGQGANASGIDVELARLIAQRLGLNLKLRMVNAGENTGDDLRNHLWKGHYLGGGVADLMLHVGYDRQFAAQQKNVVLFAPYFHESLAIAYRPERIKSLQSPIALTEHRIGVEGDTLSDQILSSAYGGALRSHAVRESSLLEAVADLEHGGVDAVMGPKGELEGLLAQRHLADVAFHPQEPVGQMRTAWDIGMAVKNTGEDSLSRAVSEVVAALKLDGSLKNLFLSHGVSYSDAVTNAP